MMKEGGTDYNKRRDEMQDQPYYKKEMLRKKLQKDAKRFASSFLEYSTATDMMVQQGTHRGPQDDHSALFDALSPLQIKKQSPVRAAEGISESFLQVLLSETIGNNESSSARQSPAQPSPKSVLLRRIYKTNNSNRSISSDADHFCRHRRCPSLPTIHEIQSSMGIRRYHSFCDVTQQQQQQQIVAVAVDDKDTRNETFPEPIDPTWIDL
jgi:hypothetical protein